MNVYIRIKPPSSFIQKTTFVDKNEKYITLVQKKHDVHNKPILNKHDFKFSKIFDIDYMNEDIFGHFGKNMVLNFLTGKDCTLYLYGQTGSGKTHTLLGYNNELGILGHILQNLTKNMKKASNYSCLSMTCYQLYCNKIFDIFSENNQVKGYNNGDDEYIIQNLKKKIITKNNFKELLETLTKFRHVSVSSENDTSSRSHLIINIHFGGNVLRLIDLAGSEKLKNAKVDSILNENADINKSILSWKECIRALKRKQKYIPYRGHLLTRILKNSFNVNNLTFILGTISCENKNVHDSLNTLKYMKDITLIELKKNENKKILYKTNPYAESMNFKSVLEYKNTLDIIKKQREDIINLMISKMTTSGSKAALLDVLTKEIDILENMRKKMI